ncbi:hypothetical protein BpHYR1_014175 [Brachionus plicatilis]|uniref:Uncharacterized protein n=1 Tax=Brachionus plicatilis TaxID=10195 RepID=A0A3M7SGC3_BRAPC|nr:hypothetical protein BpHYR1_014175 [Brachionus plicatilis]
MRSFIDFFFLKIARPKILFLKENFNLFISRPEQLLLMLPKSQKRFTNTQFSPQILKLVSPQILEFKVHKYSNLSKIAELVHKYSNLSDLKKKNQNIFLILVQKCSNKIFNL